MNQTQTSARERLLDAIHFTECANQGTTPDALLDAYRDQVLAEAAEMYRAHYSGTVPPATSFADVLLAARAGSQEQEAGQ